MVESESIRQWIVTSIAHASTTASTADHERRSTIRYQLLLRDAIDNPASKRDRYDLPNYVSRGTRVTKRDA